MARGTNTTNPTGKSGGATALEPTAKRAKPALSGTPRRDVDARRGVTTRASVRTDQEDERDSGGGAQQAGEEMDTGATTLNDLPVAAGTRGSPSQQFAVPNSLLAVPVARQARPRGGPAALASPARRRTALPGFARGRGAAARGRTALPVAGDDRTALPVFAPGRGAVGGLREAPVQPPSRSGAGNAAHGGGDGDGAAAELEAREAARSVNPAVPAIPRNIGNRATDAPETDSDFAIQFLQSQVLRVLNSGSAIEIRDCINVIEDTLGAHASSAGDHWLAELQEALETAERLEAGTGLAAAVAAIPVPLPNNANPPGIIREAATAMTAGAPAFDMGCETAAWGGQPSGLRAHAALAAPEAQTAAKTEPCLFGIHSLGPYLHEFDAFSRVMTGTHLSKPMYEIDAAKTAKGLNFEIEPFRRALKTVARYMPEAHWSRGAHQSYIERFGAMLDQSMLGACDESSRKAAIVEAVTQDTKLRARQFTTGQTDFQGDDPAFALAAMAIANAILLAKTSRVQQQQQGQGQQRVQQQQRGQWQQPWRPLQQGAPTFTATLPQNPYASGAGQSFQQRQHLLPTQSTGALPLHTQSTDSSAGGGRRVLDNRTECVSFGTSKNGTCSWGPGCNMSQTHKCKFCGETSHGSVHCPQRPRY